MDLFRTNTTPSDNYVELFLGEITFSVTVIHVPIFK